MSRSVRQIHRDPGTKQLRPGAPLATRSTVSMWSELGGVAQGAGGYEEEGRDGECEGVVAEVGGGPCAEDGSEEECYADEAEVGALGFAFGTVFG